MECLRSLRPGCSVDTHALSEGLCIDHRMLRPLLARAVAHGLIRRQSPRKGERTSRWSLTSAGRLLEPVDWTPAAVSIQAALRRKVKRAEWWLPLAPSIAARVAGLED